MSEKKFQQISDKKPYFSNRDALLNRMAKMFVAKELIRFEDYHLFCMWAKGKSQEEMFRALNTKKIDLTPYIKRYHFNE